VLFDWECLPRSNLLGAKASIESYKSGAIGVLPGGEDCRVGEDGVGCLVDADGEACSA
jgi:hypothetical protein